MWVCVLFCLSPSLCFLFYCRKQVICFCILFFVFYCHPRLRQQMEMWLVSEICVLKYVFYVFSLSSLHHLSTRDCWKRAIICFYICFFIYPIFCVFSLSLSHHISTLDCWKQMEIRVVSEICVLCVFSFIITSYLYSRLLKTNGNTSCVWNSFIITSYFYPRLLKTNGNTSSVWNMCFMCFHFHCHILHVFFPSHYT